MAIIKPHTELGARQGLDHQAVNFDLAFFFCHRYILAALLPVLQGAPLDAADRLLLIHAALFALGDEPAFVANGTEDTAPDHFLAEALEQGVLGLAAA